MSLRVRLVVALVALFSVGMATYGVGTYRAFADAERERFDEELRRAVDLVVRQIQVELGQADGSPVARPFDGDAAPPPDGPPVVVAPGTYGALYDDGALLGITYVSDVGVEPDLTGVEPSTGGYSTVGSLGSDATAWRVYVEQGPDGLSAVVASPLSSVDAALDRLVLIETVAGAALLALLAGGAWLIVGSGLRPLERMAAVARSISAGSLEQRVDRAPADTEVGQLATALNGMLDELEEAFRERQATEARLRQFLADASHELRTPLTSIQGFAELLRLGSDSDHVDLPTAMRRIEQESARMRRLIEDLLTLARLDELRPVEAAPVDLAVLAADACSDAVAVDPNRSVRLDAPEPVRVTGDEAHLRQAIGNLTTNALRHTPDGTAIEVAARRDGDAAVVTLRDHGPGLDERELGHLFERFWQADPSRVGAGSGLGLSIVHAIAQEHGGTVSAGNAPGGGAIFTLRVPVADDARDGHTDPGRAGT